MGVNDNLFVSENGLKLIAKLEGCILNPYLDVAKLWTIGIGKLILPTDSFSTITNAQVKDLLSSKDKNHPVAKIKIPEQEAFQLLRSETKKCEDAIKKNIIVPLNQNQFDALVSWSFNCGTGVLKTSTLSKVLNQKEYSQVPERLLDWCKATVDGKKVVIQGLKNRRVAEGQLWSTPVEEKKVDKPLFSEEEKNKINAALQMSLAKQIDALADNNYQQISDEENKC